MSGINPVERWREDGIIKDDRDERIAALEAELREIDALLKIVATRSTEWEIRAKEAEGALAEAVGPKI